MESRFKLTSDKLDFFTIIVSAKVFPNQIIMLVTQPKSQQYASSGLNNILAMLIDPLLMGLTISVIIGIDMGKIAHIWFLSNLYDRRVSDQKVRGGSHKCTRVGRPVKVFL